MRRLASVAFTLTLAACLGAGFLVLRSQPPGVESAGPYNVGGNTIRTDIEQKGPCQPGALAAVSNNSIDAAILPNGATPLLLRFTAPLNDVPGFRGCIAPRASTGQPGGPQYLVIDNELFLYANLHTRTTMAVDSTTQSFNLYMESCYGFPPSDVIYVGMERMAWDTGNCDQSSSTQDYLHITSRPDATDFAHGPNAFVRVHGLLYIVGRGALPKFLDYGGSPGICVDPAATPPCVTLPADSLAYTTATTHGPGAAAHSPSTYARCSDWLTQTPQAGDDSLTARTRCALIYEPGYNEASCDSTPDACYWPVSPPLNATVLRRPVFPLKPSWDITSGQEPPQYDELYGFIDDDGTGYMGFTDLPISSTGNCQLFFTLSDTEQIWIGSEIQIPTGSKTLTGTGTLYMRYYVKAPGTAGAPCSSTVALTIPSTLSFSLLSGSHDTDGDGCADRYELNGTLSGGSGLAGQIRGARDPLNRYDYLNATGDGLNRVDDILAVVNQYFNDDPPNNIDLTSTTDRTALKPSAWNLGKPNGQQRVDDILAAVKQYFHDCPPP